jgi:hypothetical protein
VNVRLVLLLVLAMAMPAAAGAQMITAPGVVVEATPVRIDPTARVPLATLPRGTDVTVVNVQEAWVQVAFEDLRYGRRVGYVPRSAVSFSMPGAPAAARAESPNSLFQPVNAAPATAPGAPVDTRAASAPAAAPTPAKPAATRAAAPPARTSAATPVKGPATSGANAPIAAASAPAPAAALPPLTMAPAAPINVDPAEKAPIQLVESQFPAIAPAPSRVKAIEAGTTSRQVVSIGNAFPDLTPSGLPGANTTAGVPEPPTRAAEGAARVVAPPVMVPPAERAVVPAAERAVAPAAERAVLTAEPTLVLPAERDIVLVKEAPALPPAVAPVAAPAMSPAAAPIVARAPSTLRMPVSPKRGMPVTLMIPRSLLAAETSRASRKTQAVRADVTGFKREGAAVNGVTDWMRVGLPSLLEGSIRKITRERDHTALEVETAGPRGDMVVTLRFADSVSDPEATLGQLLVEGGASTAAALAYRAEAHAALADAIFIGDLKELPEDRKLSILSTLQTAPGAPDVHLRGGQVYASFDLGVDERVFDERSADEASIVAYVLSETVLPEIRKLARSLADARELHGMRVLYRIPHYAHLRMAEKAYRLEMVVEMKHIAEFAGAAMTNEAFVDAATILVDGHRIRVELE